jgi:SAM-dependent methyltransferase
MIYAVASLIFLIICFGGVLFFGAPYLPTLKSQITVALELADLKSGQTLLELGCGDGKVVIAAAKLGYKVIGYELNPLLALVAWIRTRRYGKQVKIVCADFWHVSLPKAEAIFVFLLPRYMKKLDLKIEEEAYKPVRLVSFAFEVPGRKHDSEMAGVYLYKFQ